MDVDGKPSAAPSAASEPEPSKAAAAAKEEPKTKTVASGPASPPSAAPKLTPAPAPKKEKPAPKQPTLLSFPDDVLPGLAPLPADLRVERRVKMSRMRLRIAERLKESQNTAASLTTFNEVDMSSLMEFRNKYKDMVLKDHEVKLGFMSAFVKASVAALQAIPAVNGSIEDDEMVYRDFCDVSVAVATPKVRLYDLHMGIRSMYAFICLKSRRH